MTDSGVTFDSLMFTDADFDRIVVEVPDRVVVRVRNVSVVTGTRVRPEVARVIQVCKLQFDGVTRSERKVYCYRGKATDGDFLPPRVEKDVNDKPRDAGTIDFYLEGRLLEPLAWIEWEVSAAGFTLSEEVSAAT